MKTQSKREIVTMLKDAYNRLGISDARELETKIKEALAYLRKDREHYIEVTDENTPEYYITTKNGVICKTVPLAQEIIRDQEKDHVREHKAVFMLMLTDDGNSYVCRYSYARLYPDRSRNSYSNPVYCYADLKSIRKQLVVCSPQKIRPITTQMEWEAYQMMFAVFARLNQSGIINTIPHKTERAMLAYEHALQQQITIAGKVYSGKLVPLASEQSMWNEMRKDHQYSYRKELCLLITGDKSYYVLKTRHIYSFFRKKLYDNTPGACAYEPTEEKQETTYAFVALSDISQKMYPLYY